MLELVLPAALGIPTCGAAFFAIKSKMKSKRKAKDEQAALEEAKLSLEEAEQFSSELLDKEYQVSVTLSSVCFHWYTVDHKRLKFPMSVSYTRGSSLEEKERYEEYYSGKVLVKDHILDFIKNEVQNSLTQFMKVATSQQLVFYEHKFEKEIAKNLAGKMLERGLVLSDFNILVEGYDSGIILDIPVASKHSFKSILQLAELVPTKQRSLRGFLSGFNEEGTNYNSIQRPKTLSLSALSVRMKKLEDAWMKYELNPVLLLNYPLMSDASCNETANFLLRIEQAKSIQEEAQKDKSHLNDFANALELAELAFVKAESNAKKVRHAHLTSEQRKAVEKSRPLVAMYRDEKASPHERISAFKQANRNLEGVMMLPERPIMGLLETA